MYKTYILDCASEALLFFFDSENPGTPSYVPPWLIVFSAASVSTAEMEYQRKCYLGKLAIQQKALHQMKMIL